MHLGFDLLHLHGDAMGKLARNTATLGAHWKREMFITLVRRLF